MPKSITTVYKVIGEERLFSKLHDRLLIGFCKVKKCWLYRRGDGPRMDEEECRKCVEDK